MVRLRINKFVGSKMMKRRMLIFCVIVVLGIYLFGMVFGSDFFQPSIATKILRFHVLANSDSREDQAVKEEVRDAVGVYLQPLLEDAESLEETKQIVGRNIEPVVEIAKETLAEHGYDYEVTARITKTEFPEKRYGSYVFPEGDYEALQIVIGEGEGQNWWCVLYPNMCFKGSVFEVIEEEADEALREVLNPWEYASVFDSGKVELRFKFLEYFTD